LTAVLNSAFFLKLSRGSTDNIIILVLLIGGILRNRPDWVRKGQSVNVKGMTGGLNSGLPMGRKMLRMKRKN